MRAIDFVSFESAIKTYIQNNFGSYLGTLPAVSEWTDDFLDLDKHKKAVTVFFDFPRYSFGELSNMSRDEDVEFHVIFVVRGGKEDVLKANVRKYAAAFYNFFYDEEKTTIQSPCDRSFAGLVDTGIISSVAFYDAAEGNPSVKICDVQMSLRLED